MAVGSFACKIGEIHSRLFGRVSTFTTLPSQFLNFPYCGFVYQILCCKLGCGRSEQRSVRLVATVRGANPVYEHWLALLVAVSVLLHAAPADPGPIIFNQIYRFSIGFPQRN